MKELIESVAAKAAGGWQNAGSKFDFEVFALPGGSVIAVALWCWSMAMMMVKSAHEHHSIKPLTLDAQTADSVERGGTDARTLSEPIAEPEVLLPMVAARAGCTWRGAHCT
ncbi:MAG: hypothetical protein M3O26_04320 [Pseudomonadota bacterium]|nr:hypothetical protein [Pseudomonadota bacterium]